MNWSEISNTDYYTRCRVSAQPKDNFMWKLHSTSSHDFFFTLATGEISYSREIDFTTHIFIHYS